MAGAAIAFGLARVAEIKAQQQPAAAFQFGGVVDSPTYFGHGPGGRHLGVAGEAGQPEGIFPLERRRDGRLGVLATIDRPPVSNSRSVTVSPVINVAVGESDPGGDQLAELVGTVVTERLDEAIRPGGSVYDLLEAL